MYLNCNQRCRVPFILIQITLKPQIDLLLYNNHYFFNNKYIKINLKDEIRQKLDEEVEYQKDEIINTLNEEINNRKDEIIENLTNQNDEKEDDINVNLTTQIDEQKVELYNT